MKEHTRPEELDQRAMEDKCSAQEQEDAGHDRRSFLTRAAIGVAGAAGLAAFGAQAVQAGEGPNAAVKSKILNRIRSQMAAQASMVEDGDDAYVKNSHALYIKAE